MSDIELIIDSYDVDAETEGGLDAEVSMSSTPGAPGADGREIELQAGETHIQWRYVGDEAWIDLLPLADLKGADGSNGVDGIDGLPGLDGSPGADGREIELDKSETHIRWRYVGGSWADLVALADLKGADGAQGSPGADGTNGTDGQNGTDGADGLSAFQIWLNNGNTGTEQDFLDSLKGADGANGLPGADGQNGADGVNGVNGVDGLPGVDGKEVELRNSGTNIEWRYVGDVEWTTLTSLAAITGADGQDGIDGVDGINGVDGEQIQLQAGLTHIQWKYAGDAGWTDLIALSELKGADGVNGQDGIDGQNGIDGENGAAGLDGADGKSAYEIWLDAGNYGDVSAFLISLVGYKYRADVWTETAQYEVGEVININGNSYAVKVAHEGAANNKPESGGFWDSYWFLMAKGGLSAYEIWVLEGGSGTVEDFLNSLKGADGQPGAPGNDGQDGTNGVDGAPGANGQDGISVVWKGSLAAAPESPLLNWGYYNTADKISYIWDGTAWQVIAKDGADGSGGSSVIDDDTVSESTTWSSNKINSILGDIAAALDAINGV